MRGRNESSKYVRKVTSERFVRIDSMQAYPSPHRLIDLHCRKESAVFL